MITMQPKFNPAAFYYDIYDYRQSYEREDSSDTRVTLTAEVRFGCDEDFEKTKVKVIDIGPDPPLCVRRYIWGRKSKFLMAVLFLVAMLS